MTPEELRGPVSDLLEEHGFDEAAALVRELAAGRYPAAGVLVRLKPMQWREESRNAYVDEHWYAITPLGQYDVLAYGDGSFGWREAGQPPSDMDHPCASVKAGKQLARRDYFARMSDGLEKPVPETMNAAKGTQ